MSNHQPPSVSRYLLDRIAAARACAMYFGLPGDYNLTFLDEIEAHPLPAVGRQRERAQRGLHGRRLRASQRPRGRRHDLRRGRAVGHEWHRRRLRRERARAAHRRDPEPGHPAPPAAGPPQPARRRPRALPPRGGPGKSPAPRRAWMMSTRPGRSTVSSARYCAIRSPVTSRCPPISSPGPARLRPPRPSLAPGRTASAGP